MRGNIRPFRRHHDRRPGRESRDRGSVPGGSGSRRPGGDRASHRVVPARLRNLTAWHGRAVPQSQRPTASGWLEAGYGAEQADDGTDGLEDGMRSVPARTPRRTLVSIAVTVAALGWGPTQAVAADGPLDPLLGAVAETTSGAADLGDPVQGTVDQAVDTVSGTTDNLSDPLPDPVDEVLDTTTDTVEGVSGSASGIVDPVSDATSGTVDSVAGSTTDVASGVTDAVGTPDSGLSLIRPCRQERPQPGLLSAIGQARRRRPGRWSSAPPAERPCWSLEGPDPAAEVGSSQGAGIPWRERWPTSSGSFWPSPAGARSPGSPWHSDSRS